MSRAMFYVLFHKNVYLDIVNPVINGPDQFGFSTFPIMVILSTTSRHISIIELFSIETNNTTYSKHALISDMLKSMRHVSVIHLATRISYYPNEQDALVENTVISLYVCSTYLLLYSNRLHS